MIYLKKFENHEAYSAATLTLPNVSLCQQENEVHYNPYVDPYNGHEYVDLGLPSGKKWAKYLIGMTGYTDIENALYFQWGDTNGRTAADIGVTPNKWDNYKWCNGTNNSLIKYNSSDLYGIVDNKEVIEIEDDAANTMLGGGWRMPSVYEFYELTANTTQTVETIEGVEVQCFNSKTNGEKLYIPFTNSIYLYLWSSSRHIQRPYEAHRMYIKKNKYIYVDQFNRYDGYCILGIVG